MAVPTGRELKWNKVDLLVSPVDVIPMHIHWHTVRQIWADDDLSLPRWNVHSFNQVQGLVTPVQHVLLIVNGQPVRCLDALVFLEPQFSRPATGTIVSGWVGRDKVYPLRAIQSCSHNSWWGPPVTEEQVAETRHQSPTYTEAQTEFLQCITTVTAAQFPSSNAKKHLCKWKAGLSKWYKKKSKCLDALRSKCLKQQQPTTDFEKILFFFKVQVRQPHERP